MEEMVERLSPAQILYLEGLVEDGCAGTDRLEALCREHEELAPELEAFHRKLLKRLQGTGSMPSLPERDEDRYSLIGRVPGQGVEEGVFEAREEILGRVVTLKAASDVAAEGNEQLLREALITSRLDHPGIVPVHELAIDGEGRPFFSMRRLRGRDLREVFSLARAKREGWDRSRALEVVIQLCEVLAFAHSRGVTHGDLRPESVVVGEFGEVVLTGWARARSEVEVDLSGLSLPVQSGFTFGDAEDAQLATRRSEDGATPSRAPYRAPELDSSKQAIPSRRSDVYAIGAVLYLALWGRPPLPSEVQALAANGRGKNDNAPPVPTEAELVAIVARALAIDPEERYVSPTELAEDLRSFLEHRVVSAHATGAWAELRKWVRRNRGVAAIAAGVLAVTIVALSWKALGQRRTDLAIRQLADLVDVEALVDVAAEFWPAKLEPRRSVETGDWIDRRGEMREWLDRVETLLDQRTAVRAELGEMLSRQHSFPEDDPDSIWRFSRQSVSGGLLVERARIEVLQEELARLGLDESGPLDLTSAGNLRLALADSQYSRDNLIKALRDAGAFSWDEPLARWRYGALSTLVHELSSLRAEPGEQDKGEWRCVDRKWASSRSSRPKEHSASRICWRSTSAGAGSSAARCQRPSASISPSPCWGAIPNRSIRTRGARRRCRRRARSSGWVSSRWCREPTTT